MANFPSRPATALPGSIFISSIMKMVGSGNRDDLISNEIIRGNFPNFLRSLIPITISEGGSTLVYNVLSDYIAVGDDIDYVRTPLGGPAAQKVADAFGCILPTTKMSDQIWKSAKTKLPPKPLSGAPQTIGGKTYSVQQFLSGKMTDTDTFEHHNQIIQQQLKERGHVPGELVAGSKKDIVLSNDIAPGKLGIHGMHEIDGRPLQPGAASPHIEDYNDYSSGVRLVDRQAKLNGKPIDLIRDILQNPEYSHFVTDGGVLHNIAYNYDGKQDVKSKDIPEKRPTEMIALQNKPTSSSSGKIMLLNRLYDFLNKINI